MKIIRHSDTYTCEKTGHEFNNQWLCEFSESYEYRPCLHKVGDKVLANSRYDGYLECTVTSTKLVTAPTICRFDENNATTITRFNKEVLSKIDLLLADKEATHKWVAYTDRHVEVSKDGTCSNGWWDTELIPLNNSYWDSDISKAVDGDTVKRKSANGEKEIITRYHSHNKLNITAVLKYK